MKALWTRCLALRPTVFSPELALGLAVGGILAALIIPLTPSLLDLGLALNLALSAGLLIASLQARHALQLTAFPSLLLFVTLMRLSLNVSSTRLALTQGEAGQVIEAFGAFVVQGNAVVGLVIFAILTLVQFVVVAKGAERVAEVSARFNLDAMPGKQMAIDADLRSGLLAPEQAQKRRRALERESQMFGAMDGAMKFVKGDVLASLIIVGVNLLGGCAVGVLQLQLTLSQAASTFALIAIGDGLVSQLASLCVTLAAALLVTRVASERAETSLASELSQQFLGPEVLGGMALLCGALALLPEVPTALFCILGLALGAGGGWKGRRPAVSQAAAEGEPGGSAPSSQAVDAAQPLGTAAPPLTLQLSPELSELIFPTRVPGLMAGLASLRRQLHEDLGLLLPSLGVQPACAGLPPGGYRLLLDGVPLHEAASVQVEALYVLTPPEELPFLDLTPVLDHEPGSQRPISRFAPAQKEALEGTQLQVLFAEELLVGHLARQLRSRAAALLGLQEVQRLVDALEGQAPVLVKELTRRLPLTLMAEVLRKLLEEGVSIRPLRLLLEVLVSPTAEGDAAALAERCRRALQRQLSHRYAPEGSLFAHLVSPSVEQCLRQNGAALDPTWVRALLTALGELTRQGQAILLTAPDVRRTLRQLCAGAFPEVAVLTYGELEGALHIHPLGELQVNTHAVFSSPVN